MKDVRSILSNTKIIPVLAFKSAEEAVEVCGILIDEGMHVLELTMRHPSALDAMKAVKSAYGERAVIGMGTITQPVQVGAVQRAGADFGVSPGLTKELASAVKAAALPFLPAISTVSEAMAARDMGFEMLKFFPAEQSGGVAFLKSIGAVLPDLTFCPTGGMSDKNAPAYLELSNVVCFGSSAFVVRGTDGTADVTAIKQAISLFKNAGLI